MKLVVMHMGRKGAGPTYSWQMACALYKQGIKIVLILSSYVENKKYYIDHNPGFDIYFINTYSGKFSYLISVLLPKNIIRLAKIIKKENPDYIYIPMGDMWNPFVLPLISKYKIIYTIHDVNPHEGEKSVYKVIIHKISPKYKQRFIVLSEKSKKILLEKGIPSSDIEVIPHAAFTVYGTASSRRTQENRSFKILFFGRIIKYKGLEVLLNALKDIPNDLDISLRIAGSGDLTPYQDLLKYNERKIELFHQWISDEDVAKYFKDVDVVVLPYTDASQSGVIPLAYAFSNPVIVTDVGSLAEQVVDGITGFVINPNDAKSLAHKIIWMYENRSITNRMGKEAYSYMIEHLTWEASANKLINFINSDNT